MPLNAYQLPAQDPARQQEFFKDVLNGLTAPNKHLNSKYFYDAEGDALFRQITQIPGYYLYRCEAEILQQQGPRIARGISRHMRDFDLIELGPGDGSKSIPLMEKLLRQGLRFSYHPVDISASTILYLQQQIALSLPGLPLQEHVAEYLPALRALSACRRPKLVLFLGASIGNFSRNGTIRFLQQLSACLHPGDLLFTGFDLKKNPARILAAYNDPQGLTRAFNLNLLKRINRELGGNFNLSSFMHHPTYEPTTGACKSFLISLKEQEITLQAHTIHLQKDEPIFTERSMKYALNEIEKFAFRADFSIQQHFLDKKRWFTDTLWKKR